MTEPFTFAPTPKSRAGVRVIPVPIAVTEMLARHLAEFGARQLEFVFSMPTGRPVNRSSWSDAYRRACATVGVQGCTRTHDLRHAAASAPISSGLSVSAVQAVLGHASPAETLEVYTHLWPSDEERTREAIGRMLASWLEDG